MKNSEAQGMGGVLGRAQLIETSGHCLKTPKTAMCDSPRTGATLAGRRPFAGIGWKAQRDETAPQQRVQPIQSQTDATKHVKKRHHAWNYASHKGKKVVIKDSPTNKAARTNATFWNSAVNSQTAPPTGHSARVNESVSR